MFEQLKEMNAELEQLKAQHLEKSKTMFTAVSKQLFEKHPILESFGWRQYTPYFNDGEECTFSAHIDEPDMNGENEWYDRVEPKNWKNEVNARYDPILAAAYNDVKEFLSNVDESALRDMFGDHVQVTVSKDATEVEQHDHD